jgi:hypothetical protein
MFFRIIGASKTPGRGQRVFDQVPENILLQIYKTRPDASAARHRKPMRTTHYRQVPGAAPARVFYQSDAFYLRKFCQYKNTKTRPVRAVAATTGGGVRRETVSGTGVS